METKAFEVVVNDSPLLYENPIVTTDGSFMSPKGLVLWASESGEPRKVAAAAALIKTGKVKDSDAVDIAERARKQNIIGFLSSLVGKTSISGKLKPTPEKVKLLRFSVPQNPEVSKLADKWHVVNPISKNEVEGLIQIYG